MREKPASDYFCSDIAVIGYLALAKLLIHFLANGRYGYFRDELYYLACAEHLDWGYVDQPPLIAGVAWLSRKLLGESLFAIRFFPAVAGALKVFLTGLLVRELGGRRYAQVVACIAVIAAPIYLGIDNFLSMNAFEPLFWTGCVYLLVLLIKGGNPKLWLWFGMLAGLGLENKHSTLFFGFSLIVGLLLTQSRRLLLQKWFWVGGGVALAIFLPNLVWQMQRGFPTIELLRNVEATGKNVVLSPVEYVLQQVVLLHPLQFPLWIAGLAFFLLARDGKSFRAFGWAYLVLLATFIALHGKNYYVAPAYPMLFAGGAIALEGGIGRVGREWLKPTVILLLVAGGGVLAPLALPVLPPEKYAGYERALGIKRMASEQSHIGSPLPQIFSDQFGWEEMTATVARVYYSLAPDERAKTAIFGNNYGEAGAIDFFGPRYGLPKAISGHQNYFYWGPRGYTGEIAIVLGDDREGVEQVCRQVEEPARLYHPYAIPFENGPVFICRGLDPPLPQLWPRLKKWR